MSETNSSATLTSSDHFSQTAKMVSDNSEPSREPTQEQVEAWVSESCLDWHRGYTLVDDTNRYQTLATLAHAAGYEAGMRAGGKDAWEQAANIAGSHECGGPDDFTCQHQNCAFCIEGAIRAAMQEPK